MNTCPRRIGLLLLAGLLAGCNPFGMAPPDRSPDSDDAPAAIGPGEGFDTGGNVTILLLALRGEDHVEAANFHLNRAREFTGWDNLFVINKEDYSGLYWGRYASREAAEPNLKRAKEYVTPIGRRVYQRAIILPLPGKDVGPEKYNLLNARGAYSVLVAVFQDLPDRDYFGRKKRAVELCTKLRAQGKEAYFYHDTVRSGVTLGTFPADAVQTRRVRRRHPKTGDTFFQDVKYVADPRMKELMKQYPELLYCGNTEIRTIIDPETGKRVRKTQGSMPVSIAELRSKRQGTHAYDRPGQR